MRSDKPKNNIWTAEVLNDLYKLRHGEGKDWKAIQLYFNKEYNINKSTKAIDRKYDRVNWDLFFNNPKLYVEEESQSTSQKWSKEEMLQLDAYLQSNQSYAFIAEKLGRSISSVESRDQHTDWAAWRKVKDIDVTKEILSENQEMEKLVDALLNAADSLSLSDPDFKRLNSFKEEVFLEKTNLEKMPISMKVLKEKAVEKLIMLGYGNPENISLAKGTYLVVGDSHGKNIHREMFNLLYQINKNIKVDKIIHIGHILDDDDDISYDWGNFKNLIIVAKTEELKVIQKQRNKFNFNYEIVRDSININNISIYNQDLISDYVKTPISSMDKLISGYTAVINCHRHEFSTRCGNQNVSYIASPGCLCERHIQKTARTIDFTDGGKVKLCNPDTFVKYRRMKQMMQYWEQGVLIINVDKDDNVTIIPCSIKNTTKGPAISYFDKIISSKGVFNPDKKIFVNGDMHCDLHDVNVLDVQEQICKDYKPNIQVNVGDAFNYASINHHVMDRGGIIVNKKILDEAASAHYVLKRVFSWAKESYIICGNHERFAKDFVEKFPQFEGFLNFPFLCSIEGIGYKVIPLKDVLPIGSVKFVHGEMKMYGQSGSSIMEKSAKTFGRDIFIGHIHRPEIRYGCYSIGLSGVLDQHYNEPQASNWLHGFGMCNQFMGASWLTTIAIVSNKCVINNKTYSPINPNQWKSSQYKASICYDFE